MIDIGKQCVDRTCESFSAIVSKLDPHIKTLKERMNDPLEMCDTYKKGNGPIAARKIYCEKYNLEVNEDFPGCYVFMKGKTPFYVGISNTVLDRINQHVTGSDHYSATLAFKLASNKLGKRASDLSRDDIDALIKGAGYKEAKEALLKCKVAVVPIENTIERYLFEVYVAMEWRTGRYNSFATH